MNLLTNNKKIKAVIFDMDGVLIDAKDWHYDALNEALEIFGAKIELTEHLSTFDGLPTKRKLDQAKSLSIKIISQDKFEKLLNKT